MSISRFLPRLILLVALWSATAGMHWHVHLPDRAHDGVHGSVAGVDDDAGNDHSSESVAACVECMVQAQQAAWAAPRPAAVLAKSEQETRGTWPSGVPPPLVQADWHFTARSPPAFRPCPRSFAVS